MQKVNHLALGISVVSLIFGAAIANAAEIKVLSDDPLEPALVQIAEAFRRDSGHEVKLVFDRSPVIHKRVVDGETADVIIIQPNYIDEYMKIGKVAPGQHPVIVRVGIGLMTRADAPAPDISTPQALKQALSSANTLVFNNIASGNHFAAVLESLGIADAVKAKVTRTGPGDVAARIVQGKGNDIGVAPIMFIVADKRLKLVGPLPSEFQRYLAFTAAPMTGALSADAAREFIRFLTSPSSKAAFAAAGAS